MLHQGIRVTQDQAKGKDLIEKAAENGSKEAQLYLAKMYQSADSVPYDSKEMFHWLEKAIEPPNPHSDALYMLGDIHFHGTDGQSVDFPMALHYFKLAGKHGNPDALCNMVC